MRSKTDALHVLLLLRYCSGLWAVFCYTCFNCCHLCDDDDWIPLLILVLFCWMFVILSSWRKCYMAPWVGRRGLYPH